MRLILAGLALASISTSDGREVFQVTFGTRPVPQQRSAVTDSVSFIQEAPNGDIFVAGNGASVYTDTSTLTKPMVARINSSGEVVWKQIYNELQNHDILAFASRGQDQYIVLKHAVRDPSGRVRETETVTLRRIDGQGNMSRELGRLEGVRIYDTTPVLDTELQRFVLAGIDATGMNYSHYEQRDVNLYEFDLSGNIDRLPFPNGVTGLRYLRHAGGDVFVFLRMETFYSAPLEIVSVDKSGELEQLIDWHDPEKYPENMVVTGERIFLVSSVGRPQESVRILAYSPSGETLWHQDFKSTDYITAIAGLRSGGLIFSSVYEGNPVVTVLGPDGRMIKKSRFRSVKRNASVAAIRELSDGWLALAGATGPGGGGFVSADSDAMLTVMDPSGAGLSKYDGCMVDAAEIERLRLELAAMTGMEVRRDVFFSGGAPSTIEQLPPIDNPVAADFGCGSLSEEHLLTFLKDAVEYAKSLNLIKPSDRARISVILYPDGKLGPRGYRESRWIGTGNVPSIEVEYGNAVNAVRFIAENVLPYTERSWAVFDRLQSIGNMWVGRDSVSPIAVRDLPFKDTIRAAEKFLSYYDQQPDADQRAFGAKFAVKPIVFSPDKEKLHIWGDRWLHVGENRIGEVFEYSLRIVPGLQSEIDPMIRKLQHELGIIIRKRPALDHAEYLATIEEILQSSVSFDEADVLLIRKTGVSLMVGGSVEFQSDLRIHIRGRQLYITPAAASLVLTEIIANADVLLAQPQR